MHCERIRYDKIQIVSEKKTSVASGKKQMLQAQRLQVETFLILRDGIKREDTATVLVSVSLLL